jgi:hypothetical protein
LKSFKLRRVLILKTIAWGSTVVFGLEIIA